MVEEGKSMQEQDSAQAVVERDEVEAEAAHEEAAAPIQTAEVSLMKAERDQLRQERDSLVDRLARLQAEFDNARKREARERQDAREYTVGNTVEPFLGVMDNFQLALKSEGSLQQLKSGVELILKQMEEALRGLNVTAVETVGVQFDPRVHEALGTVASIDVPDHQVVEEIRRGYKLREKLLRPAMVKIAENPAQVND